MHVTFEKYSEGGETDKVPQDPQSPNHHSINNTMTIPVSNDQYNEPSEEDQ